MFYSFRCTQRKEGKERKQKNANFGKLCRMQQYGFFKNNGEHKHSFRLGRDRKHLLLPFSRKNKEPESGEEKKELWFRNLNCINHFARKPQMHVWCVYVSIHFVIKSAIILQLLKEKSLDESRIYGGVERARQHKGIFCAFTWCSNYTRPDSSEKQFKLFVFYWKNMEKQWGRMSKLRHIHIRLSRKFALFAYR